MILEFPQFFLNLYIFITWVNQLKIKFGDHFSDSWKLCNGVRQGGILSPHLFNVYINCLLDAITQSGIGCRVGIHASNVIAYADDIVIMSPSLMGLQRLLNICNDFASNLKLKFNLSKSVCMKFQKNYTKLFWWYC